MFSAIDINFLFVGRISQPFLHEIPKCMRGSSNRPFQRGLGQRATFLEDGGLATKGNPLLTAKVDMQLQ